MATENDRRHFLGALGAGASGVVLAAAAEETQAAAAAGNGPIFQGTSRKGDIQEALDAAIRAAMASARGNDRQVRWTLKSLSGMNGGIVGAREITATIEASIH